MKDYEQKLAHLFYSIKLLLWASTEKNFYIILKKKKAQTFMY